MSETVAVISGGYDYHFLDTTDNHKCPICHYVVRDAYQVNCCGNNICKECLRRCLRVSNCCPICRCQIGKDQYFKDTKCDREIMSLTVYCSFSKTGCKWKGELRNVEKHVENCLYQSVTCEDCGESVWKLLLSEHASEKCPNRKHKCSLCGELGSYATINFDHPKECPEISVNCRNDGCSKRFKRRQMSTHTDVCPKKVIGCPFNLMGCGFSSKRESVAAHIEKDGTSHLNMIAKHMADSRMLPTVIKLSGFNHHKEHNSEYYSGSFYSGVGGYKLRLVVLTRGCGAGEGTHISLFLNIMPGLNDDSLEWPLRGSFTVTLLNQIEDDNHHSQTFSFDRHTPENDAGRKYQLDDSGWGLDQFVSHSSLNYNDECNTQYLKDNTVYFRVSSEIYSQTKSWLAVV